ncbi:MAG: chemotaxis protein CheA [Oscillatoriaceae bacterium SKW80]|nr:chemotaxis protein CheA [Oscillatoriaceae bacterium SKYG93]MCX8120006.1 chemotaxis protein CheA [Oscillatoriaceae bacterium SKW80]MDW8454021.1 chemotaxis protein CheA [Oscillatoriaceae cyanobacterium SKYGB_i_bin93]
MSNTEANNQFAEFLDDYFAETDEHLMAVRQNLLALDMNVNQSPPEQSILDQLLRSFHSIKGLSGMVGVKEAEQLAHEMESYLRALRGPQISLTEEGLNALISGTQMLEQVIEARRTSNPAPDITNIIKQLKIVISQEKEKTANLLQEETVKEESPETIEVQLKISPEEKQRLDAAIRDGVKIWHFEFTPMPELAARGVNVNYIRERLKSIGKLIHAAPRIQHSGSIVFDFLVASNTPETNFTNWKKDGLNWIQYSSCEPSPTQSQASLEPQFQETGFTKIQSSLPELLTENSQESESQENKTNKNIIPTTTTTTTTTTQSNVVRVDLAKLDELMRIVGELVTSRARLEARLNLLEQEIGASALRSLREVNQTMESQLRELRESVTRARLVPIGEIFARMQFAVRDLARETQKKVSLTMSGQQTEIDKFIVDRMIEPLLHLVRNAVSHGLETEEERIKLGKSPVGNLALRACTVGETVVIEIEDDGRGVDIEKVAARARKQGLLPKEANNGKTGENPPHPTLSDSELLDILCAPGFSIREEADLTSGRGVGMTIVKNTVQELGGSLTLSTSPGAGTKFIIQLPLTLAIADALIVTACGQTYAVPQSCIEGIVEVRLDESTQLENNQVIFYRGSVLPLWSLKRLFKLSPSSATVEPEANSSQPTLMTKNHFYAFVVGNGKNAIGIIVDRLIGLREIVVRPLKDPLVHVPGISGATDLGDGRVVLILDPLALLKKTQTAWLFNSSLSSR